MPDSWHDDLTPVVRQLQIIMAALAAGCTMFLVIVLVIPAGEPLPSLVVTYTAIVLAAGCLVARAVVPGLMIGAGRRRLAQQQGSDTEATDVKSLLRVLVTSSIVAGAVLEGPTFFLLIAYLVDHSPLALAAGIALILAQALQIPTHGRVVHWVENQLAMLQRERLSPPRA